MINRHKPGPARLKPAAFLGVFLLFTGGLTLNIEREGTATLSQSVSAADHSFQQREISVLQVSLFPAAHAQGTSTNLTCSRGILEPDSTLTSKQYVSSCKPYYSGFLGLGTLFRNTIKYCESRTTLRKSERVRLLGSWETGPGNYRYSEVEFKMGNDICRGWISDGQGSERYVIKD